MTIRLANRDDAGAIAAMLAQLAHETGDAARFATTPETIRAHGFGADPMFAALIAEEQGAPRGLALFFRHYSTTRAMPGAYVQDLWVAPEARGKSLGTALLAAVADHAAAGWGARYIALTAHGHNGAAQGFYTGLGFAAEPDDVAMFLTGASLAALAGRKEVSA